MTYNHTNSTSSHLFAAWEIILFARINIITFLFKNECEPNCGFGRVFVILQIDVH